MHPVVDKLGGGKTIYGDCRLRVDTRAACPLTGTVDHFRQDFVQQSRQIDCPAFVGTVAVPSQHLYDRDVTSPTNRADRYWAEVFQVERSQLRQPGLHITYVDDPNAGIYVLGLDEAVRVRAPRYQAAVVNELTVDTAIDRNAWLAVLRGADPVVLGPAAHYLAGENVGSSRETINPSLVDVQQMIVGVSAEDVEESGILEPDIDRFGLWADGALAAVSSLSPWVGGRTDVGLFVAPEFRGRGLGRQVAAIALNDATQRTGIARWRCREDNAASVALAASFRLQPYARNLGIRLR